MTVAVVLLAVVAAVATIFAITMARALPRARARARLQAGRAGAFGKEAVGASSELAETVATLAEVRSRLAESEADLAEARAQLVASAANLGELSAESGATTSRLAETEGLLAECETTLTQTSARLAEVSDQLLATDGGPTLSALWHLAELEYRAAARVLGTAGEDARLDVASAVDAQVQRVREEIGTPGELTIAVGPITTASRLIPIRAIEALLATLGRHCDAYDLDVTEGGGRLVAVMVCDRYDERTVAAGDLDAIAAALQLIDGRLELDRTADGRFRARLDVAVTPP